MISECIFAREAVTIFTVILTADGQPNPPPAKFASSQLGAFLEEVTLSIDQSKEQEESPPQL